MNYPSNNIVTPCEWCHGSGTIQGYGAFPGGDPRNFDPDEECSTDEERENHERACAAWDAGRRSVVSPSHQMEARGDMVVHMTFTRFGLGVYTIPCFECSGAGETMEAPCVVCGTPPDEGCLCALRDVVTP